MTRLRTIAIAVIATAVAWSATASAFSSITTARARWPGAPAVVNYQINANFASTAAGTAAQQDATIRAAAASWNATGKVDLRASAGTTTTVANDGVNAIFASPMTSGNALAVTFVWSSGGNIIEFDMVFFEGAFQFAIPANLNNNNFDIQSIALHELGHAVGLGHSHGRSLNTTRWATWVTYAAMKDHAGDFNGDGKDDMMKFDVAGSSPSVGGVWVGLSNGSAFTASKWADWITYPYMQEHIGDFNGDGKDDIMKFDVPASGQANGGLWVGLSDGARFNGSQWGTWITYKEMRTHVGDFNGDGKDDVMKFDILGRSSLGLWVGLSDGTRFNASQWATWVTYPEMKTLVGDFNGDGKDDIMKFDVPSSGQANGGLWVGLSDGSRFNTTQWATWITYKEMKVLVGDFNGDGKDDIMKFDVSGHSNLGLWVGLSDGTRFNGSQWDTWTTYPEMKVHAGDFNGDTVSDVMKFDVPSSGISNLGLWFGQSVGNRFFTTGDGDTVGLGDTATGNDTDMWSCSQNHPEMKTHVGDFDGDHVDDVLKIDVLPSGQALTGLYVGLSRDDANPVMFPSIGRNQANRTLEFDELNAIGCYYR
jgi:hypothetical protein